MEDNSKIMEDSASLSVEVNSTVSNVTTTGLNQIDSLLSGVKWGDNHVTFSFPTLKTDYTGYTPGNEPDLNFVALNAMQQNAARTALAEWASICNLNFTETTGGTGEIRFGTSSDPSTSWAYYPSSIDKGGDVWFGNINSNAPKNPIVGSYSYATYIHEIGHALGLKHPHDTSGTVANLDIDSIEFSIMSYRSYVGADLTGYTISNGSYPIGPMLSDIAAIQHMYGANYNYNAEDTVYKFDPKQTKIFETIWDGGGNDTYDLSAYTTNLQVDLSPGGWNTFSTSQLSYLGNGHYARGSVANAYLSNGDTRSLIENAIGGTGDDTIIGNQADNLLTGGGGNDFIDGSSGVNTAGYYGQSSQFFVVHDAYGRELVSDCTGVEGNDTLTNIQQLKFSDKTVSSSYEYFDGLRYIASNGDLINAFGTNQNAAKDHFINCGFREGRKASFDALSYIAANSDLINIFGTNQTAAETHYINNGYREGRATTFDSLSYIAANSDLINIFGTNQIAAETHYINNGYREGRATTFDSLSYIAANSDLINIFGTNQTAAEAHYINNGYREGRKVTFDGLAYIASYSDLINAFGTNQTAAEKHYINSGYREGRTITFDSLSYIASYGDLINAFGTNQIAAENHYINNGYKEGRQARFNVNQYLANYADLRNAFGSDIVAATKHYIQNGFREGRTDKALASNENTLASVANVQSKDNIDSSTQIAAANNSLFGTIGTDIVNSNSTEIGANYLYGSKELDYFNFNPTNGNEIIMNGDNQDIVRLGNGFTVDNLTISQSGNDLVLNASRGDMLTISGWATTSNVNCFQFTDGANYKVQVGHFARV